MSCDFGHLDGSYVLGALSPAERRDYEEHLETCPACARAVQELAGLPGLLSHVDPDVLEDPPAEEPVPETLLPALVREVRRSRRRRTTVAGVLAAAAAAVVVTLGAVTLDATGGNNPPTAAPTSVAPVGTAMKPVGYPGSGMTADVALTPVAWGTRLDLVCSYARADQGSAPTASTQYVLVVRTRDGHSQQIATWHALPGRTMRLAAATSATAADIASVEVRTATGQPVLRLAT